MKTKTATRTGSSLNTHRTLNINDQDYRLIKKEEEEYNSAANLSLDERLKLIDEMLLFPMQFKKEDAANLEISPHVKMLIDLVRKFKRLAGHYDA